jgi:hypothetical protein
LPFPVLSFPSSSWSGYAQSELDKAALRLKSAPEKELRFLLRGESDRLPHPDDFHSAHNGSIPCGARFPLMPNEQVLKQGVDAFVFLVVQLRIFVKCQL